MSKKTCIHSGSHHIDNTLSEPCFSFLYLSRKSAARADPPAVWALLFLLSSAFASFPESFGLALHLRQKA